jgi:O-succinylbenzoate synthase
MPVKQLRSFVVTAWQGAMRHHEEVKIEALELRRVRLPLATPFRTSIGTQAERELLLVRVLAAESEGWGECAALPEPTYTAEYVDGAHHVIREHLAPRLLALDDPGPVSVAPALAALRGHPMAKAALEMAVIDADLRTRGDRFRDLIGSVRERVEAGVAVGIVDSVPELLDIVDAYVEQGYRRVKLKVEPGWDVEPARAVRRQFGDDLLLQVDANGAYTLADAGHLALLDDLDLLLVEQPLPEDDLRGHAELARRLRTPICLDESIGSARSAADAIALGACSVVNVKPGRVGGYLEARRVHDVCVAAGVSVWCGGMLESGLARAANVALAALPGFTLPGDLSASSRWYPRDLTEPLVLEDGCLAVPDGPGFGVHVLPDVLEECTTAVDLLRR